jgi:hypothetical protein
MKELIKNLAAWTIGFALIWASGGLSWVILSLNRWPCLPIRYWLSFCLISVIALLLMRRVELIRESFVASTLFGLWAGLISATIALITAHFFDMDSMKRLSNGFRSTDLFSFFYAQLVFAFFKTLGWLYGAIAFQVAFILDSFGHRFQTCEGSDRSKSQTNV